MNNDKFPLYATLLTHRQLAYIINKPIYKTVAIVGKSSALIGVYINRLHCALKVKTNRVKQSNAATSTCKNLSKHTLLATLELQLTKLNIWQKMELK